MSINNLCFRAKIRKYVHVYPCTPQFFYIKVGCKGVYIIQTCYSDRRLSFWLPTNKGEIEYSADIDESQAISLAFELASSDQKFLEEATLIARRHIDSSKQLSSEMPWPPSSNWLLSPERKPPAILKETCHLLSPVKVSSITLSKLHVL